MSRIDFLGDRLCLVGALLILGYFIFNLLF